MRSSMFRRPEPGVVVARSNPRPSSSTENARTPSSDQTRMRMREASAYFATFCRASRQQKYAAASTSCG